MDTSKDLALQWERITASRIAMIYIAFSILNCTVRVIFQAEAFSINTQATDFLSGLVHAGNASLPGFFVLGSQLRFCDHVPKSLSTESCQVVWDGVISGTGNATTTSVTPSTISTPAQRVTPSSSSSRSSTSVTSSAPSPTNRNATGPTFVETPTTDPSPEATILNLFNDKRSFLPQPQVDFVDYSPISLNGQTALRGLGPNGTNVILDHRCLVTLNWPVQTLGNTKREDVAFLAFQFWVLGMSLVAVLNESIPHIIATVVTHLSATAWSGFQIFFTNAFHNDFQRLTTDGACQINLLPHYWTSRASAEIPSLAFNAAALLVSCYLSFRLIKLFGWQTFKRVGASRTINRIYKLVLTLSIVIQLSLFFVILAVILWLDQIYNGAIGVMATQSNVYQAFLMIVILLIPWLLTGWFAARRELKFPMMVFLVLSALYLVGWGLMFDSESFRWTFVQWGFFGSAATLSALLDIIGLIVGIMCRLNFDKGLVHYLSAKEPLRGDSFIQAVPGAGSPFNEKFDFPSMRHPIPTFLDTLESNDEVPLPSQMRFQAGPRFFNQSAAPFDWRVDTESITRPSVAHSTSPKTVSPASTTRKGSADGTSIHVSPTMTMNEPFIAQSRWVIE
ncbi:hypothetical protein BJV74DRAFT_423884 [Russula compacta]|nr:hypothetical protein BJV74DRAFT_423884 [Russula compacta]